jgi:hypothetical protein
VSGGVRLGGHSGAASADTGERGGHSQHDAIPGPLLFGRYAFAPNRLGYCGPDDNRALLEYVAHRRPDSGLVELERRFEGAYPYLRLIAEANGIPDPFDIRVVEAYWIGNGCLERVDAASFYDSLSTRFKGRMNARTFDWLAGKLSLGARPHHNFHVFDVYMRTGLMNDNRATIAVQSMDSCRISWGTVVAVDGPELVVERPRLALVEGKLALTPPEALHVTRQFDGLGFADDARAGDVVAIHWSWACEVLTATKLQRLRAATRRYMDLANATL